MGSLTSIDTNSPNSIVHYMSLLVHTDVSKLVQTYSMILDGRHQPTFGIARTNPTFRPFFARTTARFNSIGKYIFDEISEGVNTD